MGCQWSLQAVYKLGSLPQRVNGHEIQQRTSTTRDQFAASTMTILLLSLLVSLTVVSRSDAQAVNIYDAIEQLNRTIESLGEKYHFMATFSEHKLIGAGVVQFDKVLSNVLGVYDSGSGKFTAARDGLYIFMAQIFIRGTGGASLELTLNENAVAVWNVGSSRDLSGELVYPLFLKTGDKVYVVSRGKVNVYGESHSFFSGYLI